jgi:DNA polymerase I-like protein with 3'-5' exonuclease and polymerase domains
MGEEKYVKYAKNNYGVRLTYEEAGQHREGFFTLYSDLDAWHERSIREAEEKGYTLTPFGRYRFDIPDATQAINTPIQSTGSDLTMFAQTIIDENLQKNFAPEEAHLIGFIHDAILILAKKSVVQRVRQLIAESMENPPLERVGIGKIPVPLVAEVMHGPTWAQAKEFAA